MYRLEELLSYKVVSNRMNINTNQRMISMFKCLIRKLSIYAALLFDNNGQSI